MKLQTKLRRAVLIGHIEALERRVLDLENRLARLEGAICAQGRPLPWTDDGQAHVPQSTHLRGTK